MEKYIKKISKILEKMENYISKEEIQEKLEDIRTQMIYETANKVANKEGKQRLKYAKEMLKESQYIRPKYTKQYIKNGKYMLCNGYNAVALNEELKGIELTEDTELIDVDSLINKLTDIQDITDKINFDKILELEIKNKSIKEKENKIIYMFKTNDDTEKFVNPLLFREIYEILGGKNENITILSDDSSLSPIVIKSNLGEGLVLPVRMNNKEKTNYES